jgi:glycosyltransferase involved in cell wall biosynthesis
VTSLTTLHIDTERGWRGGERQVLWLCEVLRRMRHRVLLATRPTEPLAAHARERGLEVVPCTPRFEFDPCSARRLRDVVRGERVDVIHAHTAHAVSQAALAKRGTNAAMVVTRRVDFVLRQNWPTRWKYRQADRIIAISRAVSAALTASGVDPARIELIPSGIDLTRTITPASPERLSALGIPPGVPLVVQVSQLVTHKDPLTFVRAVAVARRQVPTLHALLAGEGYLRPEVDREIAALDMASVLQAPGYCADADALLAAASVCTLSSEEEGLGTVLLDAMSLGKPVVATAAGGIPEIVEAGSSGLLAPVHDHAQLGRLMARVLTEPDLGAQLAAGARARAAAFSVEETARRTCEVYSDVLAKRRP